MVQSLFDCRVCQLALSNSYGLTYGIIVYGILPTRRQAAFYSVSNSWAMGTSEEGSPRWGKLLFVFVISSVTSASRKSFLVPSIHLSLDVRQSTSVFVTTYFVFETDYPQLILWNRRSVIDFCFLCDWQPILSPVRWTSLFVCLSVCLFCLLFSLAWIKYWYWTTSSCHSHCYHFVRQFVLKLKWRLLLMTGSDDCMCLPGFVETFVNVCGLS